MNKLGLLVVISFINLAGPGCGAFEDAASSPSGSPGLSIEPFFIEQGGYDEYTISYTTPPPWAAETTGHAYVISLDLGGSDIQAQSYSYNGVDELTAVLVASNFAKPHERKIYLTCGYEKFGHKQQKYSAYGYFYVRDRPGQTGSLDGGTQ